MSQFRTSDQDKDENNENPYLKNITYTLDYITSSASITSTEDQGDSFRDPVIILSEGNFEGGETYYVKIPILKNAIYDCTYDIKLLKSNYEEDKTYQFIKQVSISKGAGSINNTADVVLVEYDKEDGTSIIAAAIPVYFGSKESDLVTDSMKDGNIAYIAESETSTNRKYYYFDNNAWHDVKNKWNDQTMSLSWLSEDESNKDNYYTVNLIFKAENSEFNKIIVEKIRTIADYNTTYEVNSENNISSYYGIKTEIFNGGVGLFKVNNVLGNQINNNITKLGVWAHPNSMLSINGEEIRVGYSGYYEFSSDNLADGDKIDSIGLIVEDAAFDKFLIDYEYMVQ